MGLGKTLSTLALICWHLDAIDDGTFEVVQNCWTTLVVVPKSSKSSGVCWDGSVWDN
jgi:SNF2 family DNA or RNA helicase